MPEPDLAALRALRLVRRRMLADVEGMEILAEGHEHAAMIRVLLGNRKAENVAIEPL